MTWIALSAFRNAFQHGRSRLRLYRRSLTTCWSVVFECFLYLCVCVCVCVRAHACECVCVCLKLDIVLVGSFCMLLICDPVGVCVWVGGCLLVYMCVCVCVCSFLSLKLLDYSQMTGLEWMCGVQVMLYYGYILFLMLYVYILLCVGDYI